MSNPTQHTILVTGATGRQGGAVTRHLLRDGWQVRALTRNPTSAPARALAALGASVVTGDMNDLASLHSHFAGAYGVYSVQNPYPKGTQAEIQQGKHVADAAHAAGVQHLVYGSGGIGTRGTNIPSWESKVEIEEYIRSLGLPFTVLRPMALMELMTDKAFYPAIGTWRVMPKIMGWSRKLPWICADDIGAIAAQVFSRSERFIGQDLKLASDEQSLADCRTIYRAVWGKNPAQFPMPVWVYKRFGFVGQDSSTMWRWLRTAILDVDLETARSILPSAHTVEAWLREQKG